MDLSIIALIVAALADIATTVRGFRRGYAEANPFYVKLFGKQPSLAALLAVRVVACAGIVYGADGYAPALYAVAAIWAIVAVRNWIVVR